MNLYEGISKLQKDGSNYLLTETSPGFSKWKICFFGGVLRLFVTNNDRREWSLTGGSFNDAAEKIIDELAEQKEDLFQSLSRRKRHDA